MRSSPGTRRNFQLLLNPMPSMIGTTLMSIFASFVAAKPVFGGLILIIAMNYPIPEPYCLWLDIGKSAPIVHMEMEVEISALAGLYLTCLAAGMIFSMQKMHQTGDLHNIEDIFFSLRSKQRHPFVVTAHIVSVLYIFWSGISLCSLTKTMFTNSGLPMVFDWSMFVTLSLSIFFWKSESDECSGARIAAAAFLMASFALAQASVRLSAATLLYTHMLGWVLYIWSLTSFEEAALASINIPQALCLSPVLAMTVRPPAAPANGSSIRRARVRFNVRDTTNTHTPTGPFRPTGLEQRPVRTPAGQAGPPRGDGGRNQDCMSGPAGALGGGGRSDV